MSDDSLIYNWRNIVGTLDLDMIYSDPDLQDFLIKRFLPQIYNPEFEPQPPTGGELRTETSIVTHYGRRDAPHDWIFYMSENRMSLEDTDRYLREAGDGYFIYLDTNTICLGYKPSRPQCENVRLYSSIFRENYSEMVKDRMTEAGRTIALLETERSQIANELGNSLEATKKIYERRVLDNNETGELSQEELRLDVIEVPFFDDETLVRAGSFLDKRYKALATYNILDNIGIDINSHDYGTSRFYSQFVIPNDPSLIDKKMDSNYWNNEYRFLDHRCLTSFYKGIDHPVELESCSEGDEAPIEIIPHMCEVFAKLREYTSEYFYYALGRDPYRCYRALREVARVLCHICNISNSYMVDPL